MTAVLVLSALLAVSYGFTQDEAADEKPAGPEAVVLYGEVLKVVPEEKSLVVQDQEQNKKYTIKTNQMTTFWLDYEKIDITKISPKDHVEIEYVEKDSELTANWVEVYRQNE